MAAVVKKPESRLQIPVVFITFTYSRARYGSVSSTPTPTRSGQIAGQTDSYSLSSKTSLKEQLWIQSLRGLNLTHQPAIGQVWWVQIHLWRPSQSGSGSSNRIWICDFLAKHDAIGVTKISIKNLEIKLILKRYPIREGSRSNKFSGWMRKMFEICSW